MGLNCPQCGSKRLYRDGLRYLSDGSTVQRWLCRECTYRFTDPKQKKRSLNCQSEIQCVEKIDTLILKSEHAKNYNGCGSEGLAVSELRRESPITMAKALGWDPPGRGPVMALNEKAEGEKRDAGATETSQQDVKGKLVEFAWWLKKQGFSPHTINNYTKMLKLLKASGADLLKPETVSYTLAKLDKSESWKCIAVCSYSAFAKMLGYNWTKPKVNIVRRMPFIPLERELDDLIAAASRKTACFLQLLKETGMRAGEALRLKWTDVDFERQTITLNAPEKGGNPRVFKVSPKLLEMLNMLPKRDAKLFPATYASLKMCFLRLRKKLAHKLSNPRLLRISFHTFRHWKATMEYHKTKDPLYVKELLGHKKLDTTLLYVQVERTLFQSSTDEFTVKVARTPEEIKALLEVGFDYICEKDGLMFFRKRK